VTRLRESPADRAFIRAFEAGAVDPAAFDHRAHVRLAYGYLAVHGTERAVDAMRDGLRRFLAHHDLPASKYHETLTRAWVMAVRHFMERSPGSSSADAFIDANPELLDPAIMLTHYSAGRLFSDEARARYVEPDIQAIPEPRDPELRGPEPGGPEPRSPEPGGAGPGGAEAGQ
jgi:hypothetical protein